MATYYRWRRSTVEYVTEVLGEYTDTQLLPTGNMFALGSFAYMFNTTTISDGAFQFSNDVSHRVRYDNNSQGMQMYSGNYYCFYNTNNAPNGTFTEIIAYTPKEANPSITGGSSNTGGQPQVLRGTVQQVELTGTAGTFVDYVYSTSSTDYPNGGVSGNYYYDQRTTVTSPTAPTGLTYPNPITTPTVTVSWQAATSNVPDYPVDYYSINYNYNGSETDWPGLIATGIPAGTTSYTVALPASVTTAIKFAVRATDSNGQRGSLVTGPLVPVYLPPTLTVPSQLMQGQQAAINWTDITAADSYTVQRKANTDADWVQVYSGAANSFSETVGSWTSVQYRVQAVFSGTPGGWAESAAIPVISASALVISGTDSDLGTVTNDIPYTISTDTGNQITATVTVNSAVIFSGNVTSGAASTIPVLDLVAGSGTIVIEASVTASSGTVSAVRTWTYTKAAITFPNAGGVAQLTQEGSNIFPKTLAECVRPPGGGALDQVMGFPAQVYTASYTGTGTYGASNPTQISFPFVPDLWGIVTTGGQGPANLFPWGTTSIYGWTNTGYITATCSYSDKTVSISGASAVAQANSSGLEHCFIGIKVGTEAAE